ncbi:hypothetical protein [Novosphingobium sp.]|jgi:heme A synthase|uniref:hypothetical protein n=1 Tax=Novosphingobium sp. TaxID=1874826 RepID=UPI0031DD0169
MRGIRFERLLFWLHAVAAAAMTGFSMWQEAHHRPWGRAFGVAILGLMVLALWRDRLRKDRQRSEQVQEPFL